LFEGEGYSRVTLKFDTLDVKEQKTQGVISASAGNQALALAHHGHQLNIPVTVVMPQTTPLMKLELCRQYGATVIIHGNSFFEVSKAAL